MNLEEKDEMGKVSVKELDELLEKMAAKKVEIEAQAEITKQLNKDYNQLKFKAGAFLVELGREDYQGPAGKMELKEEWRVTLPDNDIDKQKLFNHLRERGIFDKYATVNSNSLNALYRADWAEAQSRGEGMTFAMPGISAPVIDRVPSFKPSKASRKDG